MTMLDGPDETAGTTGHRQWRRTGDTRKRILAAAEDVFVEKGYWKSNVSDIVERSGFSVGSIYHHYGGKSELFVALWENYAQLMGAVATEASSEYLEAHPEASAIDAFCEGGRAYCLKTWEERRGLGLFYSGDTPPGYERLRRQGNARWIRRNTRLLDLGDTTQNSLLTASLTAVISEACRIIIRTDDRDTATDAAGAAVVMIRRLYADGE